METIKYTCKQAAEDVCRQMPVGHIFSQAQFIEQTRSLLRANGNSIYYYEQTIMRCFRLCKKEFGIVLVNKSRSIWCKEEAA